MTHNSRDAATRNDDDNPFGAEDQEDRDDARPGYLRAMDDMIEAGKDGPWYT